jgi:hypothetical protein
MLYPDSRHGIQASQRGHVARETHDYWVRVLLDGKLPEAPAQSTKDGKKPATVALRDE